ncbi:hypothetical protein O7627_20555 [Solwaraspora sp. WMMD1047]|uniref:hypothetical protein n=1 Tax=Solwaraspora sp. WMMD1047 TaxID=3016102 RepID=UPI00241611D7|nr:hypothetical protein [Solwaraspora sp. WMMD1047]MDG4831676.1 hypothetical protein [Solwaraspora sp. WMMD1047]
MPGEEEYFGYSTAQNQQLMDNRRLANRMGEDIRYYPAPPSGDYIEPTTNWDTEEGRVLSSDEEKQAFYQDSIEKIYKRIMGQDATVVRQLADRWYEVNQVLDDLRTRVYDAASKLKDGSGGNGGWTGQGADAFLARGPGATLLSIDAWEDAAVTNWMGTLSLAAVIENRQREMSQLWDRYTQGMVDASTRYLENKGYQSVDDLVPGTPGADQYVTFMRDNQLAWNWEAQKVQFGMARDYWSVMNEDFAGGRATVYEGPSDAVRPNPEFIARHKLDGLGVPNISPPRLTPNINRPNITAPTAAPDIDAPDLSNANLTGPNITAPNVVPELTAPDGSGANLTGPDITAPNVTAPPVAPPVLPPVLPRTLPGGLPSTSPALRPGGLPALPGKGLLSNLPTGGTPGVLRAGVTPTGEGLPPSMPQSRAGQPPPPPQIRRRGPAEGAPAAPANPQGNRRGPETQTPAVPTARTGGNQFGSPPAAPSSPVLRNPRATPPTPRPGGPRRGDPTTHGPGGGSRGPGSSAFRPDAAPPVLGRPRPKDTRAIPPIRPAVPTSDPNAPANPLAPPPRRTTPIVGRPARPAPGQRVPTESAGVLRGLRKAAFGSQPGEITSRKIAPEQPEVSSTDREFEKIRKILDKEGAWTVETPGGGVLDGARPTTPAAEPKPTLGA